MNKFFLKSQFISILVLICIACGNNQIERPITLSNNTAESIIENKVDENNNEVATIPESQVNSVILKKDQEMKQVFVSNEEKIIETKKSLFFDHIVAAGDSVWILGLKYNIDWEYIYWNNVGEMPSPSSLAVGQILNIPTMPVIKHQIVIGDTITELAQRYAVDKRAIIDFEFNNIKDENNISVSQIVYIPNGSIRYFPVTVSFYYCKAVDDQRYLIGDGGNFCEIMRNGQKVYPGAAACAYRFLGQRFRIMNDPLQRTYECADTGNLVLGWHRDIWFNTNEEGWKWLNKVGDTGDIIILD